MTEVKANIPGGNPNEEMPIEELKAKYPSVELAYPLAVNSYDVALKRMDAIDGRLQTLLAFIATVSLPVPVIGASKGLPFGSFWFIAAAIAFVLAMLVGILARVHGSVMLISPDVLFEKWLHLEESEFKKNLVYFAGEAWAANRRLASDRARLMTLTAILFLVEVAALAVWATSARP